MDVLMRKFRELEEVRQKTNKVKMMVSIGILAIVVIFAYNVYTNVKMFNVEDFMNNLKQEVTSSENFYKNHLQKIATKVVPVYEREFKKQLPVINQKVSQVLQKEQDILLKNLKNEVDKVSQDMFNIDYKKIMLEAIPELKNEKNINEKLDKVTEYLHKELQKRVNPDNHFAYQDQIYTNIKNSFTNIAKQPSKETNQKNIFDLFSYTYNIVNNGVLEKIIKKEGK